MPIPEDEMLGPDLEKRLKAALDAVVPPSLALSSARYRMGAVRRLGRAWRFAPALVAIAAAGAVISATAATGSPNPSIWRDRAETVFQSVGHFPGSTPNPTHSPKPSPRASARPTDTGDHEQEPKPTSRPSERPEPSPSPEPSERPEPSPSPDHSGGDDPSPGPSSEGG